MEETALTVNPQDIVITERGIDFANFNGLWTVANMILKARMAPDGLNTPHAIALVIARGRSVGLDPFQAMESMAVVGGKVMIYGDAPLAICRQHPAWDESGFHEEIVRDDKGALLSAICITLRKGGKERRTDFTVEDAKAAKLWGKKTNSGADTPWVTYPQRMLMYRARGYNLRDNFGDALKGLAIRELHEDNEVPANAEPSLKEQMKEEKREERKKVRTAVAQIASQQQNEEPKQASLIEVEDELESSRNWVKESYNKIPLKMNPIEVLKAASMRDGKWISFEHIDTIENVDYLKWIASNIEDEIKFFGGTS